VLGLRFAAGNPLLRQSGAHSAGNSPIAPPAPTQTAPNSPAEEKSGRFQQPLTLLLFPVIVITAAAPGVGILFTRMSQPADIGGMLAGILLGPSLLGWPAPRGACRS